MRTDHALSAAIGRALDAPTLPEVDLRQRDVELRDVEAYRRAGVLVLRGLLDPRELASLDEASRRLIDIAWSDPRRLDFESASFGGRSDEIPYKIDYVLDKDPAFRALGGHPRILEAVSAITGPGFVPTWDTLVLKDRVAGPRIPWHRDCAVYPASVAVGGSGRLVDVGVYLDDAPAEMCLRCLPGSNYWPDDLAAEAIEHLNDTWDDQPGIRVPVRAGDAVLHNILTLHSAPETEGQERRVVYFEYRPVEVEMGLGPHDEQYVAEKQRVLLDCLEERRSTPYAPGEVPYAYAPPDGLALWPGARAAGFRIPHADHWTWPNVEPVPR